MTIQAFQRAVKKIAKQEGNFSSLIFGSFERGFQKDLFPYSFTFPPLIWGFQHHHGYVLFDESAYVRTTEETYKAFCNDKAWQGEKRVRTLIAEILHLSMIVESTVEAYRSFLTHLATLFGKLFAATIYAEAMNEEFAKAHYHEQELERFFTLATLPSFETFTMRRLKSALAGDEERLRKQSSGYYLATEREGILEKELEEYADPQRALRELERERAENEKRQQEYRQHLSPEMRRLFDYLALGARLRDQRKDAFGALAVLLTESAQGLLAKFGIAKELAPFCHYTDFEGELPASYETLLQQRAEGFAFLTFHDPPRIELLGYEEGLALLSAQARLEGRGVFPGRAEGPARIIMNVADFSRFQEGDVLVTSMTRPEFVPLMKKAAAIITDEGGLTCHAAIIARELKKPCIVGTGNATRTLKDGQRVIVDGERGTITEEDEPRVV